MLKKSIWNSDNTLTAIYKILFEETTEEQRILIPKSYLKSSENTYIINKDAKSQLEQN